MSSIKRRPDGKYRARYRDSSNREHARHFERKADAQRWLDETTAAVVTGQYVDPRAGRVTVKAYAEAWRTAQVHRPTTQAHVETMLRLHVYPTFGDRPLSSVLPSEIQGWVSRLSQKLEPATVGVAHSILAGVFKAAVRNRKIPASPCEASRLPKIERKRVDPLSTEQVHDLVDAMPQRYRALVVLGAGTGLRQGECFGLTVDRVNFFRREVTVDRQLLAMPGSPPTLAPPKTESSNRVIPLPQLAVHALVQHLATFPPGPDGFIFTNEHGQPIRRTNFSTVWRPMMRRVGAPDGTTFHDLRHYYASLLIRHGESVKVVQARLGHASATETLDTYSHLWPDSEDQTRAAVDGVLLAAVSDLCQMSVRN